MKHKGFTLIELMVVVVIIGILAAIAIPNFISMQRRAKEASVKNNMHTLQLAAEDFATLSEGVYAADCGQTVNLATNAVIQLPQSISGGLVAGQAPQQPDNLLPTTFKNPVVAANNSFDSPSAPFANPQPLWAWNALNAGCTGYTAYDANIPPAVVAPGTTPSTAVLYQVIGQGVSNTLSLVMSSGQ